MVNRKYCQIIVCWRQLQLIRLLTLLEPHYHKAGIFPPDSSLLTQSGSGSRPPLVIVYPGHCNCYYGPVWPRERLSRATQLSELRPPTTTTGFMTQICNKSWQFMHYLHIVHNVYWVSPRSVVWGSLVNVFWRFKNQIWSTFPCCEFYNVVPGHCFSVWRAACEGFSDRSLLPAPCPIVSGANCSYKEIWPDHLTTKLVSYQIPVPHLRSDCLLIYIYSLMTWPARVDGRWTSDISPPD